MAVDSQIITFNALLSNFVSVTSTALYLVRVQNLNLLKLSKIIEQRKLKSSQQFTLQRQNSALYTSSKRFFTPFEVT